MEHRDTETSFEITHNPELFADTDHLLRSGVHIQGHKTQNRYFKFIEDNLPNLKKYYFNLFKLELIERNIIAGNYYYLDIIEDLQSSLGNKKNIEPKVMLFALFLQIISKTELKFSSTYSKEDIFNIITNNNKYKTHFQRILLSDAQEETEITKNTFQRWIKTSLIELEKIGWVYRLNQSDDDRFEILPSFERLSSIYENSILTFDKTNSEIE